MFHWFWRRRSLLLLMLLAAALRIWYLTINPLWPQFSNADDGDYFQRALRLAVTGAYVDDNWLIRPPFHVWIFAGWLKLALLLGQPPATFGVRLIQGFQVAFGTLMVPLCYALAARLFHVRAGLLFAAFWAIWFPFVELPATLFSEPLYLFLFTLHLWLLLRFDQQGRYRDLALAGLVLGMAALTRSPALYALVFAVPWLIWRAGAGRWNIGDDHAAALHSSFISRGSWARASSRFGLHPRGKVFISSLFAAIRPLSMLAVCTLVVVLPWTLRNWMVYQRFIPVDTLGPINLWLDLESTDLRSSKIELLRTLPQADRQAYATERVRELLSVEPLRPFRNVWPTFRHIWKAPYVEDLWVKQSFFSRPVREAALLGLLGDLLWLTISLAGVIGLLHPRTDRSFKIVTGLWLLYSFVTVLVFHVEPRYLLPIWLLLGLYAAWTLSAGLERAALHARPLRAVLLYGAVAALLVLIMSYRDYASIVGRGVQRELYMRRGDQAYARDDFVPAEQAYRAALTVDPGFVDGEVALALTLGAQHKPKQGIAVLHPDESRRSALVAGVLSRAAGDQQRARELLRPIEGLAGEDAQRWALDHLPVEPRDALLLGDGALDLGYISGFAESEQIGARSYRWLLGDGEVVLPLTEPLTPGATVVVELAAPLDLGAPLQLRVADGPAMTLQPNPQWRTYRLTVPPALVGQRQLRLRLHAPTRLPMRDDPQSNDPRALSVMVHRVALER